MNCNELKMVEKKYLRYGLTSTALFFLVAAIYHCKNPNIESDYYTPETLAVHSNGNKFVGSATCAECHQDIYDSHVRTAHFKTSAKANRKNIKGNFSKDFNTWETDRVKFMLIEDHDTFYQLANSKYTDAKNVLSNLDIVVGSGTKGQSYLTWENDSLYQLQTSYYAPTESWITSPSFPSYHFNRPVSDTCLKCHFTFAKNHEASGNGNRYFKEKMIYGIDCERCHGPSSEHVVYHRKNPKDDTARFMVKFDSLSRQQNLDVCAQCHSGLRNRQLKNPFSFVAGDDLNEYSKNSYSGRRKNELDVHGNQYGLLTNSKCFKETAAMSCTTCHDPHTNQRENTAYFNAKCVQCHTTETTVIHTDTLKVKARDNNCIACHMPVSPSKSMQVKLSKNSRETSIGIRSHFIAIYPESSWNEK